MACIANISAYLKSIEWDAWGYSEVSWTVTMIIIAGIINLVVTWRRNMREFALVGAWGLLAICVANWDTNAIVANSALAVAMVLIVSSGYHGYKNRATNPMNKWKEHSKKDLQ